MPLQSTMSRYLFSQTLKPALVAMGVMLSLIWLLQSMRFLDYVINRGLGMGTFLHLTVLLVPKLLIIVLPLAIFAGLLAAGRRWLADSEFTVMLATGQSRLRIVRPALWLALGGCVICYALTLWLMPLSESSFRTMQHNIRTMNGDLLLEPGSFNQMGGLMVYMDERTGPSSFRGLLINDARDPSRTVTWLAQSGSVEAVPGQPPQIRLENGVQQNVRPGQRVDMLRFATHSLTLDQDLGVTAGGPRKLDTSEMGLTDLQTAVAAAQDGKPRNQLLSELNSRLLSPLTPLPLTLLAAAFLLRRPSRRTSALKRMMPAVVIAIVYFSLMMAGESWGERYGLPAMALLWLLPLGVTGGALYALRERPTKIVCEVRHA